MPVDDRLDPCLCASCIVLVGSWVAAVSVRGPGLLLLKHPRAPKVSL